MSTADGVEDRTSEGFHVPRLLRAAEVLLADGQRWRGRLFLPATAAGHPGAMRVDEWLEEPSAFYPFLCDGEGRPVILGKDQLVVLTVPAAVEPPDDSEAPLRRVRVECGALHLEGDVLIDMPAGHLRVLDLLNRPGAFLSLREGERRHLVRKSRITRVSERAPAADA
jgi:hypothetical protein